MRKSFGKTTLTALTLAGAFALATPAFSANYYSGPGDVEYNPATAADVTTGAIAGTAVGVGIYNGAFGATAAAALPTTAVGAAAFGGVAGVGTVALVDAAVQPCRGFAALFGAHRQYCAEATGYNAYEARLHHEARYVRHHRRHVSMR